MRATATADAELLARRDLSFLLHTWLGVERLSSAERFADGSREAYEEVVNGAGYTRDVDVELHYRDNRLNAIHEGTHGNQAHDLLGGKAIMGGGAGLTALLDAMRERIERARTEGAEAAQLAAALDAAANRLAEVTLLVWSDRDPELALMNVTAYLEAARHTVVAWIWLEQHLAAGDSAGDFYDGKRQAARFFFRHELPRTGPQPDLLASLDRTVLDTEAAWL